MRVLALDLGTMCGWALLESDGNVYHGVENLKRKGWFGYESFRAFDELLYSKLNSPEHTYVVVEKAHCNKPFFHAIRVLFGMMGIVQMRVPTEDLTWLSAMTVKKHVTGKGNAKKEDMIRHLLDWHPGLTDHNEADALGFLHYFMDGFPWITEES